MCRFSHVACSRTLMVFIHFGNTPYGSGEGRCLQPAGRRTRTSAFISAQSQNEWTVIEAKKPDRHGSVDSSCLQERHSWCAACRMHDFTFSDCNQMLSHDRRWRTALKQEIKTYYPHVGCYWLADLSISERVVIQVSNIMQHHQHLSG